MTSFRAREKTRRWVANTEITNVQYGDHRVCCAPPSHGQPPRLIYCAYCRDDNSPLPPEWPLTGLLFLHRSPCAYPLVRSQGPLLLPSHFPLLIPLWRIAPRFLSKHRFHSSLVLPPPSCLLSASGLQSSSVLGSNGSASPETAALSQAGSRPAEGYPRTA
jgi:hypothetical protein